ncbi:hypothetical protein MSBRW_2917 [Methanosarcina barkeri str. Wiesmoor]|uniref:Uncharacterized protein n=2 Tax=Methanosarcina barkeri TaxID=2208 RepID=A0A0E3QM72_METBA|nr:hypothetical protein [Methanosarcina barkeri]AKB52170.1 hypothetical protein MSBRW_2917 [Methanosarcina barkeri str. Wiesmoor]
MKKSALISISVVFLVLVLGGSWYYGNGANVKIVDIHASPFGAGDLGKLNITLQNNGLKPVDVWLEVENAFVDENGTSYSTPRMIISDNSTNPWDEGSVSLQKPIKLVPGNNSVKVWLGYKLPGEYPVKVRVVQNSRLLEEDTYPVNIPSPEIHLKLEYEMESKNTSDVYRIYGYLINKGLSYARKVSINLTVTNERTGELVLTSSEFYDVGEKDKSPLWTWPDYPYAIVEIAHGKPLGESYMPVQNVVIGSNEDSFKVNVTARWQNQVAFAELLIPPREETR